MEIEYKTSNDLCETPCPHGQGKREFTGGLPAYVHSKACHDCEYFVGFDEDRRVVTCSYGEKEEKMYEDAKKRVCLTCHDSNDCPWKIRHMEDDCPYLNDVMYGYELCLEDMKKRKQ